MTVLLAHAVWGLLSRVGGGTWVVWGFMSGFLSLFVTRVKCDSKNGDMISKFTGVVNMKMYDRYYQL